MQRDLEMMTLSQEKLEELLDRALGILGSNAGMTYDERSSLSLLVCRVLIEQRLRETDAEGKRGVYRRRDR